MSETNRIGDIAESAVIFEALKRGYKVSIPFGHDHRYDLVVDRAGKLERVQIKSVAAQNDTIRVKCWSHSTRTLRYSSKEIDWIIVYEVKSGLCYFIPAYLLNEMYDMYLRLNPAKNNQKKGVRLASDFMVW